MDQRQQRTTPHLTVIRVPTRVPHLIPTLVPVLGSLARWAERSQRRACHNALVASTSLAAGRRERDEVSAYVETALAGRAQGALVTRTSG